MVQFLNLPESTQGKLGRELGSALGQGVGRSFEQPEQRVQRGLLQEALSKYSSDKSFEENIKEMAPALMTTQGGAEFLNTFAPLMQKREINKANLQAVEKTTGGQQPQPPGQPVQGRPVQEQQSQQGRVDPNIATPEDIQNLPERPSPESRYRNPKVPQDANSLFPNVTAGPQITPLLSDKEMQEMASNIVRQSGGQVDYNEAMKTPQNINATRAVQNEQVYKEQQRQKEAIKDQSANVVNRAVNENLISGADDPASKVVEELAYEARNAKTPVESWNYVRSGISKFKKAEEALKREQDLPDFFSGPYRKILGSYKDKETIRRDLQPFIEQYKKYNLVDEAREQLTSGLGMGPEDAEMTLYPFSKEEEKTLSSFPKNKEPITTAEQLASTSLVAKGVGLAMGLPVPGSIKEKDNFMKFKNEVSSYFDKFPDSNLITVRGKLTQDKGYTWQDYSKAVSELIEEGRFKPDYYQEPQLPIINQMPLPGLTEQFKGYLKGTR